MTSNAYCIFFIIQKKILAFVKFFIIISNDFNTLDTIYTRLGLVFQYKGIRQH